jgi:hypothetical protein
MINLSFDFKLSKIELMDLEFLSEGTKRVISSSSLIFDARKPSPAHADKMRIKNTSWRFLKKLYTNQEKLNIGFKDSKKGVFEDQIQKKNEIHRQPSKVSLAMIDRNKKHE